MNIDDWIIAYRKGKEERFQTYLEEARHQNFERVQIETKAGKTKIDIYRGDEENKTSNVYVNFHGGGFVLGYHELDGPYCKLLSEQAHCTVINVDYLLAPEHKFPQGIYHALEVIQWCIAHADDLHIDPQHMVIGGHSAGGNLAIGITRLLLDQGITGICGLLVDYAPCEQAITNVEELNQIDCLKQNRNLQYMKWYMTSPEDLLHPLASPCYQDLSNFPPTLLISAQHDPLREGEEKFYAQLKKYQINTEYHCFPNCNHGFTHHCYDEYHEENANKAWEIMANFLRQCFEGHSE